LVVVRHVLRWPVLNTHADAAAVARTDWGRHRVARHLGLSRALFTRQHLARLGLDGTLEASRLRRPNRAVATGRAGDTGLMREEELYMTLTTPRPCGMRSGRPRSVC